MESNIGELVFTEAECTIEYMDDTPVMGDDTTASTELSNGTITALFKDGDYVGSNENLLMFKPLKRAEMRADFYGKLAGLINQAKEKGVLPQDFHG